jgi:hypothetical protein
MSSLGAFRACAQTLGGLAMSALGRVPRTGDVFTRGRPRADDRTPILGMLRGAFCEGRVAVSVSPGGITWMNPQP